MALLRAAVLAALVCCVWSDIIPLSGRTMRVDVNASGRRLLQGPSVARRTGGDYLVQVTVGSTNVQVVLDTGSPTFAVGATTLGISGDSLCSPTPGGTCVTSAFCDSAAGCSGTGGGLASGMQYGSGSWTGAVFNARVSLGSAGPIDTTVTLITQQQSFLTQPNQDGILGLSYDCQICGGTAYSSVSAYNSAGCTGSSCDQCWNAAGGTCSQACSACNQGGQPSDCLWGSPSSPGSSLCSGTTNQNGNTYGASGTGLASSLGLSAFGFYLCAVSPGSSSTYNTGFFVTSSPAGAATLFTGSLQTAFVWNYGYFGMNFKNVQLVLNAGSGTVHDLGLGSTLYPGGQPASWNDGYGEQNDIFDTGTGFLGMWNIATYSAITAYWNANGFSGWNYNTNGCAASVSPPISQWPSIRFVVAGPNGDANLDISPYTYLNAYGTSGSCSQSTPYGFVVQQQSSSTAGTLLGNVAFVDYYMVFNRALGTVQWAKQANSDSNCPGRYNSPSWSPTSFASAGDHTSADPAAGGSSSPALLPTAAVAALAGVGALLAIAASVAAVLAVRRRRSGTQRAADAQVLLE